MHLVALTGCRTPKPPSNVLGLLTACQPNDGLSRTNWHRTLLSSAKLVDFSVAYSRSNIGSILALLVFTQMEIFLFWLFILVFLVFCGLCHNLLRHFIRQYSRPKKAGQYQAPSMASSFSTITELSLPELAGSDVIRGYDSPEVSRHDALIRIGLFLQTAKRPVGLE